MEYYDYHWWDAQLMHSMGKDQGSALEHSFSLSSWAANEVALAKKEEADPSDKSGFDYGGACLDSALKAFNSLCGDGHSGMSIGFTKGILNRLILCKPLTAIVDVPEVWNDVTTLGNQNSNIKEQYQCNRMSSLFKDVMNDGTIKYSDIDRSVGIDLKNGSSFDTGLITRLIDELYPITMPYYPNNDQYVVYCEDWLCNPDNGDLDTFGIFYLKTPEGNREDINRFYKEGSTETGWIPIDLAEYESRKAVNLARNAKNDLLGE